MELPPLASFLTTVLAAILFLIAVFRRRNHRLPPGPRPWPVIGNLNLIGSLPHRSFHELATRYGPFVSLRLGSVPVVVGSSVDAAKFFLKTHDPAFLDRPRTAAGRYTFYNHCNMVTLHYGAYWRQARKLFQAELFSARRLMASEHVRAEEVSIMLHEICASSSSATRSGAGRAVALRDHLIMVSLNVISRMVLGKKYVTGAGDGDGSVTTPEEFRWMVQELFVLNGVINVGDVIPWLNFLDLQGYVGRMKKLGKMFDLFLEHVLDEHNERRQREGEEFVAMDSGGG
ncbi:hypothetical protein ACP70R_014434 [Stipagrostis hirtigluma subsp. patula]